MVYLSPQGKLFHKESVRTFQASTKCLRLENKAYILTNLERKKSAILKLMFH